VTQAQARVGLRFAKAGSVKYGPRPERRVSAIMPRLFFQLFWCLIVLLVLSCEASPAVVPTPVTSVPLTGTEWLLEATNHLGQWIWTTNSYDKQTCRLRRVFDIPTGAKIIDASIHITVDNGYTLFLDGHEIGRGSDWRTVTRYDVTRLLGPGAHLIAVEGFNDRLEGGLIFGLNIELAQGEPIKVKSDDKWMVVPVGGKNWQQRKSAEPGSFPAVVVGSIHSPPWDKWPMGMATLPALRPVVVHFWQRGWFQLTLVIVCLLALTFCLGLWARLMAQSKAQKFLQLERTRIARDIHDDLGAQLTQLLLLGEVAQREHPGGSPARAQFTEICDRGRELAHAMDEVVWAVNSQRDTVRDFTSYACKYAQIFLGATAIRCRLDVQPEIPATSFDLPVRRNLLLAVKEALNNAAKHSQANELFLRIHRSGQKLSVVVEDNGRGFDAALAVGERNGLTNMWQRMGEIGGTCEITSETGQGCRVAFSVPLPRDSRRRNPNDGAAAR
jgi:two-component sensor histidine kinase